MYVYTTRNGEMLVYTCRMRRESRVYTSEDEIINELYRLFYSSIVFLESERNTDRDVRFGREAFFEER